jgi:hypothetical protein
MPNIDLAASFLILEGNTAGTNGIIQVIGSNTVLAVGSANTSNSLSGFATLTNGITLNYGSANANSTGTMVTLGYPYVSNVFSVTTTSNAAGETVAVTAANTTKITLTTNSTANVTVYYNVIGI